MISTKKSISTLLLIATLFSTSFASVSSASAFTVKEAVNDLQAPTSGLPSGVANPKGTIGSLLSELFWGMNDGTRNGKIKGEYIDYAGISAWTQSWSDVYNNGGGNIGIGTVSPAFKLDVVGSAQISGNLNAGSLSAATLNSITFNTSTINGGTPINSLNIGSQSVNYATTAGTANAVNWLNVTNKSLGATAANDTTLDIGVSQLLRWKNYGTSHVIFDASQGTAPNGVAINNTNSAWAWTASYPTLMGWNGSMTYGVRVDSSRVADSASYASSAGSATTATTATTATSASYATSAGNAATVGGIGIATAGTAPGANQIVRTDGNGYTFAGYINSNTGNNENPAISQVIVTNGSDNYYRKAGIGAFTSFVQANASGTWGINISGNAASATNLSVNRSTWVNNGTVSAVVGQLAWKNYGNGHTIFDASNGTSPDGTVINNTNSASAWTPNYPTLMGWNGASTYGVRVDSARVSDITNYASSAGTATSATNAGNSDTVDGIHGGSFMRNDANNTAWGINYFISNKGGGTYVGSQSTYGLETYSTDGGAAGMSFHRGGAYAVNMGLDPDNVFRIGGWSAPASLFQLDMGGSETIAGNFVAGGWVTARNGLDVGNAGGAHTYITLHDDESPNGVKYIHANSNVAGFLNGYGSWMVYWDNAGTQQTAGAIYAPAYYYSSDARLKHDIVSLDSSLDKLRQINPVTFKWNKDGTSDVGFIAQEMEKIYPELVTTNETTGLKAVKYGNLVAPAIAGIKALDAKQTVSESRINTLEAENTELRMRLDKLEKLIVR